ncbi:phage tail assembly chaperone family protein, TAC [Salinisphaera sp.]|uniref:phage tail assembly chaperone family protein, TAC n=1 Tax=Salinisphaera sp. TaxID=1914330 RepID=UPI000C55EE97|nr:phage tail assembly chaperone family protein, TAC [Salinisphaera sp.]MAS10300.1 hypothetical protein [Salinisphaera sp.]|tara:strand:+ start:746 stop:1168 length:423 start_codon:yes stop_codon:yes gene_type:complete
MKSIREITESGGIISADLVKRSGTWRHGGEEHEVEFYVRRLAFGDIDRVYNRDNPDASQSAELISMAIRLGDDGDEALTYEQAYQLNAGLAMLFSDHVMSVNGVGDEEARTDPKASRPPTTSGSRSQKSSAARSQKPSND